jgi:hypothetical protein
MVVVVGVVVLRVLRVSMVVNEGVVISGRGMQRLWGDELRMMLRHSSHFVMLLMMNIMVVVPIAFERWKGGGTVMVVQCGTNPGIVVLAKADGLRRHNLRSRRSVDHTGMSAGGMMFVRAAAKYVMMMLARRIHLHDDPRRWR